MAKYVFGQNNTSKIASLASNPGTIENMVSVIRSAAPYTSKQMVNQVNVFLPILEQISSFLGLYSFIGKAQNYTPVNYSNIDSPVERLSKIMTNNSGDLIKLISPLLGGNLNNIIENLAQNALLGSNTLPNNTLPNSIIPNNAIPNNAIPNTAMPNNTNTNNNMDVLGSLAKSLLGNSNMNIEDMAKKLVNDNNIDIGELAKTIIPLLTDGLSNENSPND